MTLQDEQTPIDREIVEEVVSLTPESWDRIVLEVEYSNDEDGEGFGHVIYSPDGHRDIVEPSEELFDATWRLQELFKKYGGHWRSVKYNITVDDDGISYKTHFVNEN